MLEHFGDEIWLADGPTTAVAGFRYPTHMAVIRLGARRLLIWSPVALSAELQAAVDALGTVQFLIAPNSLHHLFLEEWQKAYPEARMFAAPGLRKRRADLSFDAEIADAPDPEWAEDLDQVQVRGNAITTEVVFFHRRSGTVLFTDLIQHFDRTAFRGWRAVVARLDLMTAPEPEVPRKFRVAFVDRDAARAAVRRILTWPADKVVMAHAHPVRENGRAFIVRAFRWLLS